MRQTSLYIVITLLFHFSNIGISQSEHPSKKGFFVEGGGAAPYYSVNFFHQIFDGEKLSGYFRLGGAVWGEGVALPVGLNVITGNGNHHAEFIFSLTPFSKGVRFWNRDDSDLFLDIIAGIGYRYQPMTKSFFISGGVFPYLRLDPTTSELSEEKATFLMRPGISMGWFL